MFKRNTELHHAFFLLNTSLHSILGKKWILSITTFISLKCSNFYWHWILHGFIVTLFVRCIFYSHLKFVLHFFLFCIISFTAAFPFCKLLYKAIFLILCLLCLLIFFHFFSHSIFMKIHCHTLFLSPVHLKFLLLRAKGLPNIYFHHLHTLSYTLSTPT